MSQNSEIPNSLFHQIPQHIIKNSATLEILLFIGGINATGHNELLTAAVGTVNPQE